VVLEPAEEGEFNVSVPALDGCFTQGETKKRNVGEGQRGDSLLFGRLP